MDRELIEEKFKHTEEELKDHDVRIKDLEKTYSIMQKMDLRVGNIESSVAIINEKLDNQNEKKGAKWDKLIDYLFYFLIALILGLLVHKLGLK